jgi:predicted glycosyltransferase
MPNLSIVDPAPHRGAVGSRVGGENPHVRRPRVASYSHDAMGLGHLRRTQLIARILVPSALRTELTSTWTGTASSGAGRLPS